MNQKNITSFLTNLNLIMAIAGYSFFTTMFLPVGGDVENVSQFITIPYRAFILLISLILILLNIRNKIKLDGSTKLLLFFWLIYMIRIYFDLELRDNYFTDASKFLYYTFTLFVCFIPLLSLLLTTRHINFHKVAVYSLVLLIISMILPILTNTVVDEARVGGNVALNPISYGEVGAKSIIFSLYFFFGTKLNKFYKFVLVGVILLGLITIGRSASRGPLLGSILVAMFYFFSRQKHPAVRVAIVLFTLLIFIVFQSYFIDLIGIFSPTLQTRLEASIYEGDNSDRDVLFKMGIEQFMNNPFFGDYFVLYPESGKGINSHNIIIDSFMGLGIFGVIFLILMLKGLFTAFKILKGNFNNMWIALLLVFQLFGAMVSSAFYMEPLISIMFFLNFYIISSQKKIN